MYFPWEGRPVFEILYIDDVVSYPVALVLALTLFLPVRETSPYRRLLIWIAQHPRTLGFSAFVALSLLSPLIYQGKPLSTDEYLFWFQAHTFAQGNLYASYPREWLHHLLISPDLFLTDWEKGRILSPYWPGFSLLLAPFAALGHPWMCNPLIVGLSIVLLAAIARELFSRQETQGLVVLLTAGSACFLLNGVAFYAMPAHLLFNALFTWLVLRPTTGRLLLAGIAGSMALALHNPLPHILYATPWLAWLLLQRPFNWQRLGALAAGYLPISLILGVGWAVLRLNSHCPLPCDGSLTSAAISPGTSTGLSRFATSAFVMPNLEILEWRAMGAVKLILSSAPALVVLAFIASVRRDPRLRCLAASAVLTFSGYFFIPFDQGFGWGNRYFHSAWLTLPLLAAATMDRWPTLSPASFTYEKIVRAALLCMATIIPAKGLIMYAHTKQHWSHMPPHTGTKNEILFKNTHGNWGLFLVQNPPDLSGSPTVFISLGQRRDGEFLARYFPEAVFEGSNTYGNRYVLPESQTPESTLREVQANNQRLGN